MKEKFIKKSFETKFLQLEWWEIMTHYKILVIFYMLPFFTFILTITNLLSITHLNSPRGIYIGSVISLFIGFLVHIIQKRRLRFTEIKTNLKRDQLITLLNDLIINKKWLLTYSNEYILIFKTRPKFSEISWGEQITILFGLGYILVNSICDPARPSSIFSNGRNSQHIETLKVRIKSACR
jgi:hypothetical protein